MLVDAVIFDFDGVLVASEPLHFEAESAVIERLAGEPLSMEAFTATLGMSELDSYRHYAAHHDITQEPEDLAAMGKQILMDWVDTRLDLVDGVRDVLAWLPQAELRWCIASSGSHDYIQRALARFNLTDMFDGLVSCVDMVAKGKPAPDVFVHAAGRLGLPTARCVVIEDAANGIAAAKSAGMRAIRYAPDGSLDEVADATVTSMAHVPGRIAALQSA